MKKSRKTLGFLIPNKMKCFLITILTIALEALDLD